MANVLLIAINHEHGCSFSCKTTTEELCYQSAKTILSSEYKEIDAFLIEEILYVDENLNVRSEISQWDCDLSHDTIPAPEPSFDSEDKLPPKW